MAIDGVHALKSKDVSFTSADDLALSVRVYPGREPLATTILCLHGLTRNGKDFEAFAGAFAGRFRVLAPDQRGRGRSAYDPNPANYNLFTQCADMWAMLDGMAIDRVVIVGTSMGALMGVVMANQKPDRVMGLVLNDAGPEVDPVGLERIRGYVGKSPPVASWDEAADAIARVHGAAYPTYDREDWVSLARHTYIEDAEGFRLDYDPSLTAALDPAATPPDLWPAFAVLNTVPALVLRGALSDILSEATAGKLSEQTGAALATIPDRGHAPDLSEPESLAAIEEFLGTICRAA